MAKRKFEIDENKVIDMQAEVAPVAEPDRKSNVNPRSLENLRPRAKGRSEKKYMQLDIIGYEDYLALMCKAQGITRTKYIQNLLREDYEKNKKKYELLRELRDLSS